MIYATHYVCTLQRFNSPGGDTVRFLDFLTGNRRGKTYEATLRHAEKLSELCVSARTYTVPESTAVRDNEFVIKLTAVRDVLVLLTTGGEYAQLKRYMRHGTVSNVRFARIELDKALEEDPLTADKDDLDDLLDWVGGLADITRHVLLGDRTYIRHFAGK